MFGKPLLRFFSKTPHINFMRGRYIGLCVSAVLSIASIILFFTPGLTLGLDFQGGVVVEAKTPGPADFNVLRNLLDKNGIEHAAIQSFGAPDDVLIRLHTNGNDDTQHIANTVKKTITQAIPNIHILQADAVGSSVSHELLRDGILALVLSLAMILIYIWMRFRGEFALSAVITLLLDLTKTMGFLVVTGIECDLVIVAAILTIIGYSTNDKVVVYDRIRENLPKYRKMPFMDLINLSINETLSRTLGTSCTLFLSALPLALWGGSTLSGFAWTMLFGIVVGTSSSIFIAAPLLLFMGEARLRYHKHHSHDGHQA